MQITIHQQNGKSCAVILSPQVVIFDTPSALDFMMSVRYETGCDAIALNKEAICDDFFILSTGMAGEIIQKFVNYQVHFAIIGDYSKYTSKPLKDFMFESNKGSHVFFAQSEEQAVEKLTGA